MNNAAGTLSDLRGCGRMAIDATNGVTGLVEAMCLAVARASDPVGLVAPGARLICDAVRGITKKQPRCRPCTLTRYPKW